MLAGALSFQDIAAEVGVSAHTIGAAMRNPVRCGWINMQIHQMVAHRLGAVDAAMINRAISGDVRAADLVYKRFGQIVKRMEITTHRSDFDPTKLTDEQLERIVKRRTGAVVDAEFEEKPIE